jgi:2-oxoacid:acceptor oxidoreductase gamma subunit (pyruvate/2-ketoisovalerate family)
MIEIKIFGYGGQGTVVMGVLLTNAASKAGYHAHTFAEYGPDILGGVVECFVRISEEKILPHSHTYEPDYIVVMAEKFTRDPAVVSGLKEDGVVLINTSKPPEAFSSLGNVKIITIDARRIAYDEGLTLSSGVTVVNTGILGAIVGLLPSIGMDYVAEVIKEKRIPAPEKNIQVAMEAYRRIQSGENAGGTVGEEEVPKPSLDQIPTYRTGLSPCEADCPAGNEIRSAIALIEEGLFEEALESFRAESPFPGICGRVCFHPCETNCNRNEYDQGIAINALERAAFDYADASALGKPTRKARTEKKVAIIGSGPAGMTCAYFLALLGHDATVFEALPVLGGIPRMGIPEYRLPRDVVDKEIEQVIEQGVNVKTNTRVGKDISFEEIKGEYDACFIAAGAHSSMKLDIPGEDSQGVISGLGFLKEVALGNKVDVGDKVAVIGGGNSAVDAARTAKRLGANKVTIVYRRSAEEIPAYQKEVEEAEKEGINISYLTMPIQILPDGKSVGKLECAETRLGEKDKDGRRRPEKVEGSNFLLDVDTVISAVGEAVEASFLSDGLETEDALIKVDQLGRTSVPGVYAGGDVMTFSRSVAEAIASGKRAAAGIDIFLKGGDEQQIVEAGESGAISMSRYLAGDNAGKGSNGKVSFADLNAEYFYPSPRAAVPELPVPIRILNFDEVSSGLSKNEAIKEADRCFQCGRCDLCENCYIFCPDYAITFDEELRAFVVNDDQCRTCGICINECPRHAISWGEKVE